MASLGEFEQIVLLAILRLRDGAYGASITAIIEESTNRAPSPGALYTTLDRLEEKSMVRSKMGESTAQRGGRAKRFYKVTPEGRAALLTAQRSFQRLLNGLDLIGGEDE